MVPLLHIVCFGRRWEVTLRLFLTRSKFILSTPSYCLKHRRSPQMKDSSLPAMCPNHWAEYSALLGSKPEILLHYFSWIRGESPIQSPVVKAPSEEVRDMGLNWWIHTFCFPFKSMLITRLWCETQRVLPLSDQLLSLGFRRKWPQPSLRAQPAPGQRARSCAASSLRGSGSGFWSGCKFGPVSEAGGFLAGRGKWTPMGGGQTAATSQALVGRQEGSCFYSSCWTWFFPNAEM